MSLESGNNCKEEISDDNKEDGHDSIESVNDDESKLQSHNYDDNVGTSSTDANKEVIVTREEIDDDDDDDPTKTNNAPIIPTRRIRTRSSRDVSKATTGSNNNNSERIKIEYNNHIIAKKGSLQKRTARKSVIFQKQVTTITTTANNDEKSDFDWKYDDNNNNNDDDSTTDQSENDDDDDNNNNTKSNRQEHISDTTTATIRNEIYWAIKTKINIITGAFIPVPGELERIAKIYKVRKSTVEQIWCQGQESIVRQIMSLVATSAANTNTTNNNIQPLVHNPTTGGNGTLSTGTIAAAAAALIIQPDVSAHNIANNGRTQTYPEHHRNFTKLRQYKKKNAKKRDISSDEDDIESETDDSISDGSIESVYINSTIRQKRRVRLQTIPNFIQVKKWIDNLPNMDNNKSLTQSEIAAAINITKKQLVRYIRTYPEIDTFWNLCHPSSKTTTTTPDSENSDDDDDNFNDTKRLRRKQNGKNNDITKINKNAATTRKRKRTHHAVDNSDSEHSEVIRRRKPKKKVIMEKIKKTKTKKEKATKTNKVKKEGAYGDEVEGDNYQSAISDTDTSERRTRKRKGHSDIKVSDKEAIWIALQSNYNAKDKDIRRGHMARVAKQFNVSSSSVSRIWIHGKTSMKQQLHELEAAAAAGDKDAAAALAAGGPIIRPDFNNKRINCGQKPKYDLNKVNEMLESIPVSERKSINQTAKLLGMTSNTLWRIVNKYNPRSKPASKELEIKIQLRQQKKLANKVRSGIRNDRLKKDKKRKSTTNNTTTNDNDLNGEYTDHINNDRTAENEEQYTYNNNNEAAVVDRRTDTTIAAVGLLTQEQAVLAAIRQPWIPATNESYWY